MKMSEAGIAFTMNHIAQKRAALPSQLKKYGLTVDDYAYMHLNQDFACAICRESGISLHVDHCHESGLVRGLLCIRCNQGLGYFRDRIENLEAAYIYLRRAYGSV